MRLIPSIDLRGGQTVRLLHGDFAAETRYAEAPEALAAHYAELGADVLHVVDLDGAKEGALANLAVIERIAKETSLTLQVGGGIRNRAALETLFERGVRRAIVGSAALEQPEEVEAWLTVYGAERVGFAFDVRVEGTVPRLCIRGWTQTTADSLWDVASRWQDLGAKHVLCTDIARDGALEGPNVDLYREAVERHPTLAWQASGGVRSSADLHALADAGAAAAISGKALVERRIPREELSPFLPNA